MSDDRRAFVRSQLLDVAFKPGAGVDLAGRPLAWSLDCRELTLHGPTLATLAGLLWERVAAHRPDVVAGPSLSADPIVAALVLEARRHGVALNGALVRDAPKAYGMRKLVEGPPLAPGSRAVVVDDVLSRGTSAARAVRALREQGAHVAAVVTIVDLERDDRIRLEGLAYETLFTAGELGLARFAEPSPITAGGWVVRGVNSPIPPAWTVLPLFAGEETILCGDRCGIVAVTADGGVRTLDGQGGTRCSAALDDVVVLANATAVHAIERVSARSLWRAEISAHAMCAAFSAHIALACADAPRLLRLDARDGTVTAARALASRGDTLHALGDILMVLGASGIVAVDEALDVCWERAEPAVAPTSHGGALFVLTRGPALARLDPSDGSLLWSRPVSPRTRSQLVASDDRVVFAAESVLVGLSHAGDVSWIHSGPRRIAAGPVPCGPGRLAVVDVSGVVRVLDTDSGEHVASYSSRIVRPLGLAGSAETLAGVGIDGDAWGVPLSATGASPSPLGSFTVER